LCLSFPSILPVNAGWLWEDKPHEIEAKAALDCIEQKDFDTARQHVAAAFDKVAEEDKEDLQEDLLEDVAKALEKMGDFSDIDAVYALWLCTTKLCSPIQTPESRGLTEKIFPRYIQHHVVKGQVALDNLDLKKAIDEFTKASRVEHNLAKQAGKHLNTTKIQQRRAASELSDARGALSRQEWAKARRLAVSASRLDSALDGDASQLVKKAREDEFELMLNNMREAMKQKDVETAYVLTKALEKLDYRDETRFGKARTEFANLVQIVASPRIKSAVSSDNRKELRAIADFFRKYEFYNEADSLQRLVTDRDTAGSCESEAETAIREGNYPKAVDSLQMAVNAWPEGEARWESSVRPIAETMPVVIEPSSPKGLPIAMTVWPT